MNSSNVFSILLIISSISTVHLYEYEVYTTLGSNFEPVKGSLKMFIYGSNNTNGKFKLVDNE